MRIDVIESYEAFLTLKDGWDAVYAADPEAHFFLSWPWLKQRLQLDGRRWFILAAAPEAPGAAYVAFFPLRLRTKWRKGKGFINQIEMAGRPISDYTGLLCMSKYEDEAINAFARHLQKRRWTEIQLDYLRMSDQRRDILLRHFKSRKFVIAEKEQPRNRDNIDNNICPYIPLPGDWDEYLSGLSANTRQKARRFLRKIANSDEFRITIANADSVERDISILLEYWQQRWGDRKGDALQNIVDTNYAMLRACAKENALFLPVLWAGDRPLAAHANLVDREKRSLLFMIGGRDDSFRGPPPTGFVLHAWTIRYAIAEGFATYDFLRGNEEYKYLFAPQERHVRHFVIHTRSGQNPGRKLDPASLPQVHRWCGSKMQAGALEEAEAGYRQLLLSNPGDMDALYGLGRILAQRGNYRRAVQYFKQLTAAHPRLGKAWLGLGEALEARKRFSDAVHAYQKGVDCEPDFPSAYARLGKALVKLGRIQEARLAFETASSLDDKS